MALDYLQSTWNRRFTYDGVVFNISIAILNVFYEYHDGWLKCKTAVNLTGGENRTKQVAVVERGRIDA